MKFKKLSHKNLYKEVLLQLEEYIVENELAPGSRLPTERELAEQLEISRGTVREAFRVLESKGIITSKPGGGRFLKENLVTKESREALEDLEHADITDMLEMREVIESKIIELAIERGTKEDLLRIEKALLGSKNMTRYERDNDFHLALAEASHNNAFYHIMKVNLSLMCDIRKRTLKDPLRKDDLFMEHKGIYEAILQKDKVKGNEILKQHLQAIQKTISQLNGR